MSVQRRVNWISQQRVDVPDVRAIESAGSNDFDQLIQSFVTGTSQGYILRGFEISMTGAIGGAASGLQMLVDPGAVFHIAASQSGTFYLVPSGTLPQQLNSATNTIVDGAFAPSAINYVGIDYERFIDSSTSAQVYIWDPTTNSETTKTAPRAQILRYRLKISTTTWPSNILPIATVTTDAGNNVISITDCRWMLFRLGQGGATPNPFYNYPWTAQTEGRQETPSSSASNSSNPFHGGDKMLGDLKDWMNAVMTSVKEIKGTTYWYQLGSAGSIAKLREDLGNTITTGPGTITHSATTAGLVNWSDPIYLKVIGSGLQYILSANPSSSFISLADDEVAYITLSRDVQISPNLFFTYNSGNNTTVVTSIGSISWTGNLAPNDYLRAAGDPDSLYTQIKTVDSLTQVTLFGNYVPAGQTASGQQAVYSLGTYNAVATPSTARDIFITTRALVPNGQDIFWLLCREDNGGVVPRVYVRFLGVDLEQGDTDDIDDEVTRQLLTYIGSPSKATSKPQYVSAITPGAVPQITSITVPAASAITSGQYFTIASSGNSRVYYFWFKKDGAGSDPAPSVHEIGVEVDITTGQTAAQVATALTTAFGTTFYPDFTVVNLGTGTLTVTNNSAGTTEAPSVGTMPGGFSVSVTQSGTGTGNFAINDGDNLTLAIKKLDEAIAAMNAALDSPNYDQTVDIVASGATPPTSLTGPISSGTVITLPNNSRLGNIAQKYTVGNGNLEVFLNGQYLRLGIDWSEVGASQTASAQITILQGLVVGDTLEFRIGSGGGGGAGGGGGVGPQGPPGPTGPAGADAVGGPVAVSTKTSSYSVSTADNVLLADCTSNPITFTLPLPSSATGHVWFFKKIDSGTNAMSLIATGGALIDGLSTQSSTVQYESFMIITNGSAYYIF
jgi:hypothetical protein